MKLAALVIYAYSSFVSSWGIGPEVVKEFEKTCECKVEMVDAGDGGSMVSKLKLEGKKSRADLVIGLDQNLLAKASTAFEWRKISVPAQIKWAPGVPGPVEQKFLPFDFGPFAFIYNSEVLKNPPTSLDDLLDPRFKGKIILEDPKTSSVGLGFLLWVRAVKKEQSWDYLKKLAAQKKIVAPSWDMAYGLFKKGDGTDIVLSYWTSPAYHIQEEKVTKYKAAPFSDGHYLQTEYFGIPAASKNKKLADQFVEFIYSDYFQTRVATKNFMLPVRSDLAPPEAYKNLGSPKILPPLADSEVSKNLNDWQAKWREIF